RRLAAQELPDLAGDHLQRALQARVGLAHRARREDEQSERTSFAEYRHEEQGPLAGVHQEFAPGAARLEDIGDVVNPGAFTGTRNPGKHYRLLDGHADARAILRCRRLRYARSAIDDHQPRPAVDVEEIEIAAGIPFLRCADRLDHAAERPVRVG